MRLLFRVLVAVTMLVLLVGRFSGGRLIPAAVLGPFLTWFSMSVFVFGVFGLRAAWLAWRDAPNRRAYMADIVIAVAWVPYWYLNLKR